MTPTVRASIGAFLDGVRGEVAESTRRRYQTALEAFARYLGDPLLADVGPADIRSFRAARLTAGVSPFTVNSDLRALRRLYGWLVREGVTAVNPARSVPFVRTPRALPKAVTVDDLGRIVARLPEESFRDRAFVLFLIDTGCRVGGALGLTLDRLAVGTGRAVVTEKGARARAVFFGEVTAGALGDWLRVRGKDPAPWVFLSAKGGPLTPSGARQLLLRIGERAGVEGRCNPHAFRHAFARAFLQNGGNLATLGQLMGHAPGSPVTAANYAVYADRELQEFHARFSPLAGLNGSLTGGH